LRKLKELLSLSFWWPDNDLIYDMDNRFRLWTQRFPQTSPFKIHPIYIDKTNFNVSNFRAHFIFAQQICA